MALIDSKITDAEIAAAGVQSQPNKLTGTAAQNKAVFDALVKNLVKGKLNGLIDALTGAGAAGQIGVDTISGLAVSTVQEALQAIVEAMLQEYDAPRETIEADVHRIVEQLKEIGAVQ